MTNLEALIEERKKLLDQLGVKMRKRILKKDQMLIFIDDTESSTLDIIGAKELEKVDMPDLQWERLKAHDKTHHVSFIKKGGKITSYRKGSKKVLG